MTVAHSFSDKTLRDKIKVLEIQIEELTPKNGVLIPGSWREYAIDQYTKGKRRVRNILNSEDTNYTKKRNFEKINANIIKFDEWLANSAVQAMLDLTPSEREKVNINKLYQFKVLRCQITEGDLIVDQYIDEINELKRTRSLLFDHDEREELSIEIEKLRDILREEYYDLIDLKDEYENLGYSENIITEKGFCESL